MIPSYLLYKVYAAGTLRNAEDGVRFEILNRLMDVGEVALRRLGIDGAAQPMGDVRLEVPCGEGSVWIAAGESFALPLNTGATVLLPGRELAPGTHAIDIVIEAPPLGEMEFTVEDAITEVARDGGEIGTGGHAGTDTGERPVEDEAAGAESAGPRDSLGDVYDAGISLLASSMETYLEAQKKLLNLAIQQAKGEQIVGSRAAENARSVVAEVTTSFEELARKGVENFAAAGKLFLKSVTSPPAKPPDDTGH